MSRVTTRATRTGPVLLLAAALLSGCGSTVATTAAGSGTDTLGSGPVTGLAPTGSGPVAADVTGSGAATTGGAEGPAAGSSSRTAAGPTGAEVTTTAAVPQTGSPNRSGPGVTDTTIYIGDVQATNTNAVDVPGITRGDPDSQVRAVLDDVNSHGGIAGRKVQVVWAQFDSSSAQTADQQWAAICQKFTRDQPRVFAVLGVGTESYRECIRKAGVVMLSDDLPYAGAAHFARNPTLIELGSPNLDRIAKAEVPALLAQGYFNAWDSTQGAPGAAGRAKVGVLTYDDREYAGAVDRYLIPALKQAGYDPGSNVARVGSVNKASDYSDQAAAVQSAQLRFASSGVTHVISFEGNGGLSLFFMNNAESQHYRPRYGVNTTSALQVLLDGGLVQPAQARGAVGIGWAPGFDLSAERNPDDGPYSSASRRHCLAVYRAHGVTFSDPNAQGVALGYCNKLYLLRQALNTTPRLINATTFVSAVDSVGSSFSAAGGLGSFLGPGRHDSAAKYYYWRWFDDCGCLHYDGPRRDLAW